jgi:hypothetical protein
MHTKIRKSSLKHRRQVSFLERQTNRHGRAINNNQRNVAAGKPKRIKVVKARHNKARRAKKGLLKRGWRR